MKALIVGYGNMGREIERMLLQRNHTITARVDPFGGEGVEKDLSSGLLAGADVAIEFSSPAAVPENARRYAGAGVAAVVGTTGWAGAMEDVKRIVESAGTGYLHGSNFSIGAHMFFEIVRTAAGLIDNIPDYDIMLYEIHHGRKKDSPSGTALTTAKKVLEACTRKKRIQTDKLDRQIEPEELHVASVRGGNSPGVHSVLLDSVADTIEITHTARSRGGFALGAVMAAEWIHGKTGFFDVDDFIRDLLAR